MYDELWQLFELFMCCECEVFVYVVSGVLNKQIVLYFGLSLIIIKQYCVVVMCKMNVLLFVDFVCKFEVIGV